MVYYSIGCWNCTAVVGIVLVIQCIVYIKLMIACVIEFINSGVLFFLHKKALQPPTYCSTIMLYNVCILLSFFSSFFKWKFLYKYPRMVAIFWAQCYPPDAQITIRLWFKLFAKAQYNGTLLCCSLFSHIQCIMFLSLTRTKWLAFPQTRQTFRMRRGSWLSECSRCRFPVRAHANRTLQLLVNKFTTHCTRTFVSLSFVLFASHMVDVMFWDLQENNTWLNAWVNGNFLAQVSMQRRGYFYCYNFNVLSTMF